VDEAVRGTASRAVEIETRRYLEAGSFRAEHPTAYEKWSRNGVDSPVGLAEGLNTGDLLAASQNAVIGVPACGNAGRTGAETSKLTAERSRVTVRLGRLGGPEGLGSGPEGGSPPMEKKAPAADRPDGHAHQLWISWLYMPWDAIRAELRSEMRRAGMSQDDLAYELRRNGYSVSHGTVVNYLNGHGKRAPSFEAVQALATIVARVRAGDWSKGQ